MFPLFDNIVDFFRISTLNGISFKYIEENSGFQFENIIYEIKFIISIYRFIIILQKKKIYHC